jgi:signal transduction histidine kinase
VSGFEDELQSKSEMCSYLIESDRKCLSTIFQSRSACFSDLVHAAGLDPAADFQFSDLSGVNFAGSNLHGFNFAGANLSRTRWLGAVWDKTTILTGASLDGAQGFDRSDVREPLQVEQNYNSLVHVQDEVLDNLGQAVAVFDSNGRLRLSNPLFARMWGLEPAMLADQPHIDILSGSRKQLNLEEPIWPKLRSTVTAVDKRETLNARIEQRDGTVIDCTTVPLADGTTLVTFNDVSQIVSVERALRERNEALEEADKIKVDFVHHVSYELRSPLTNIIGFAHFLRDPVTGSLNEKQREYLGYITASTQALLGIINNILDLATIDAGAMKLNLGPVDIRRTMEAAAEGLHDRLTQSNVVLDLRCAPDIGRFRADERRVCQVLFNLLANAVGFSPAGATVTLLAVRVKDAIIFTVTDNGPGIPADIQDKVFDWFETHSLNSRHRGTGLGLSLVRSFVELHGGSVTLDSAVGRGTTVTCIFPAEDVADVRRMTG